MDLGWIWCGSGVVRVWKSSEDMVWRPTKCAFSPSHEMCVPRASRTTRRNVHSHTASSPVRPTKCAFPHNAEFPSWGDNSAPPRGEMCVLTRLVVCLLLFILCCHWEKTKTGFAGNQRKSIEHRPKSTKNNETQDLGQKIGDENKKKLISLRDSRRGTSKTGDPRENKSRGAGLQK